MRAQNKRIAKIIQQINPPKHCPLKIIWICQEDDEVILDGVKMTMAEYEAQRDPTARVITWSENEGEI